jgi:hypothetical protein
VPEEPASLFFNSKIERKEKQIKTTLEDEVPPKCW